MFTPVETFIAWRYTRAQRRTQLVSFIAGISIAGVALGITALLTILAIMNGFEKEMRTRLLGMTAHLEVRARTGGLAGWDALGHRLVSVPGITGWAPQVEGQALVTRYNAVQGAQVRGIDPAREARISQLASRMRSGTLADLEPGGFRVVLGRGIADSLNARVGDDIVLVLAEPLRTASGMLPRLKRFRVAGVFEAGVQEFDTATVFVHLADAQRLFRRGDSVDALHLALSDPFDATAYPARFARLAGIRQPLVTTAWTSRNQHLFRALATEKIVMFAILLLSVAVAAFNLVSTLVITVTDKAREIAILQTLGLTPRRLLHVFFAQGAMIGLAGVSAGALGGIALASNVEKLIAWLESALGFRILAPDVYYISRIPADLEANDVLVTVLLSTAMCLVAPVYPAWLASRTRPAEALRHE